MLHSLYGFIIYMSHLLFVVNLLLQSWILLEQLTLLLFLYHLHYLTPLHGMANTMWVIIFNGMILIKSEASSTTSCCTQIVHFFLFLDFYAIYLREISSLSLKQAIASERDGMVNLIMFWGNKWKANLTIIGCQLYLLLALIHS